MYMILKGGKLKYLIEKNIDKLGGVKKMAKDLHMSKSAIYEYYHERRPIRKDFLNKLIKNINYKLKGEDIKRGLPNNWKQVKGGIKCVALKKKNGTFEKQIKLARRKASLKLKYWHYNMRTNNPEKYYEIQHSRFKKSGLYKLKTKNKEIVRNSLERDIANLLNRLNIKYQYEPLVKVGNKNFFPDFVINNKIVIEATMWRGYDKAVKLKKKIRYLKRDYRVYVVIPKALNNYYQTINNHLISGIDELVPVAQTFRGANER